MNDNPLERSLYSIDDITYQIDMKRVDNMSIRYTEQPIIDTQLIDTQLINAPMINAVPQNDGQLIGSRIMICSQYMLMRDHMDTHSHPIDRRESIGHIVLWLIGSIVLNWNIPNLLMRIITMDGIVGCLGFYVSSIGYDDSNNFFLKHRLRALDRYIYYGMLICMYHCIVLCLWIDMWSSVEHLFMIGGASQIMTYIYRYPLYFKIRTNIVDEYNRTIRKIVCMQFAKLINIIIRNVLHTTHRIEYTDITRYYNDGLIVSIGDFTAQFIGACVFNYLDKGTMRLPLILYKNMFLKERRYRIGNDQKYFEQIVIDRKWEKFMDMYTLNRMIRMLSNGDSNNNFMEREVDRMVRNMIFTFNRLMFGWTLMSATQSIVLGILCNLLFVSNAIKKARYIMTTIMFSILVQFSEERILMLILCNILYPIIESNLIPDILEDSMNRLKSLYIYVKQHTEPDTIYGCCILAICAMCAISPLQLIGLGCVITIGSYGGIGISKQNNMALKIMIIIGLSCVSSIDMIHILVMPIIIQNVMDLIHPSAIHWNGMYYQMVGGVGM